MVNTIRTETNLALTSAMGSENKITTMSHIERNRGQLVIYIYISSQWIGVGKGGVRRRGVNTYPFYTIIAPHYII